MSIGARARFPRQPASGRAAWILASLALGCSADPGPARPLAPATHAAPESTATAAAKAAPAVEYALTEIERRPPSTSAALDKGAWGLLLDGTRAISGEAGVTFAAETADAPLTNVERVPARFGGGFLFWAATSLYASATFDGPLRAVVTLPDSIASVSFGPDALLVRGYSGDRWMIDLATGAARPPSPLGLVDVAALDDGRAIAITEAGGAAISNDRGKTWQDVRSQLRGAPGGVVARDGDLWLTDRLAVGSRALQLPRAGALVELGAVPPAIAPFKPDPRFPSGESPLRVAVRSGVRVGPWTAVIASGGDILRVDLATGAIGATAAGVVPVNMTCEGVEIPDDIAFVCVERGKASAVITGVLRGHEPHVERSFPADGPFYAGDDGALAFGGPCGPLPGSPALVSASGGAPPPPPPPTVCVRNADGQWEPFLLDEDSAAPATSPTSAPVWPLKHPAPPSSVAPHAGGLPVATSSPARAPGAPAPSSAPPASPTHAPGAPAPSALSTSLTHAPGAPAPSAPPAAPAPPKPHLRADQVRWIPRLGRSPVAIIEGNDLATYDAAWGEIRPWQTQHLPSGFVQAARNVASPRHDRERIVDRRWSATAEGAVRAVLDDGRGIEVSTDGAITMWPFEYQRVAVAGARAFARSYDGRAFQTLDHGRSWAEVAAPPGSPRGSFDPRACSMLGCDLGAWLRLGWEATPPSPAPEIKKVQRAPMLAPAPLLSLACLATGHGEAKATAQTPLSPQDLALGASRLPMPPPDSGFALEPRVFSRAPTNPPHGSTGATGGPAPRAVLAAFPLTVKLSGQPDEPFGHLVLQGPSQRPSSFKQDLSLVEPLAPPAPLRRFSWGLDAIAKAVHDAGLSVTQLVSANALEVQAIVPVLPAAPAKAGSAPAPTDMLVSFQQTEHGTLYVLARGGSTSRVEVKLARPGGVVQSAAQLPGGDIAALAVPDEGDEVILRFGPAGVTEIARLPAPPEGRFAPSNPDALALGPRGEIAVIRTPSGASPASSGDPALLIAPGPRLTALAPWSSAVTADDPSCAQTDDAYRAILQTATSWLRIAGRPIADAATSGMTARVRWSPSRLCIEAVEVPESSDGSAETIVVATFAPNAAGRSDIELGSESRAPLSCALAR